MVLPLKSDYKFDEVISKNNLLTHPQTIIVDQSVAYMLSLGLHKVLYKV